MRYIGTALEGSAHMVDVYLLLDSVAAGVYEYELFDGVRQIFVSEEGVSTFLNSQLCKEWFPAMTPEGIT